MTINIKPDQLNGTVTTISNEVSDIHANEAIIDDTGTKLNDCTALIRYTGTILGETVSKYNTFLNGLAEKFKNTDYNISTEIRDNSSRINDGKVNPSDDFFRRSSIHIIQNSNVSVLYYQ